MSDPHFEFIAFSYGIFALAMVALIGKILISSRRSSQKLSLLDQQMQSEKS